ncbi:MAG TPA: peptidoglycan DD-metalloendopeptidase family protein [Hanamia sp.]|nr:peptidoglycan DD-metalloendopeptidase family protein [Hanamia sp.]
MYSIEKLLNWLENHRSEFRPVVNFDPAKEKLISLDFTETNFELAKINLENTGDFTRYIEDKLRAKHARFGIGGYDELRSVYSRSNLFNGASERQQDQIEEPRRLHLGIDIWGPHGTEIFAPLDGRIHSFAFNDHFGDYGGTIILQHTIDDITFYTLYGHLSLDDIENIRAGNIIKRGDLLAHFGSPLENGHWPPHLHFQVINNPGSYKGDYPGVCKLSERESYLSNCPDPNLILQLNKWICFD